MGCADPRALPDSLQPLLVTLPLRAHAEMVRCVDVVTTLENGVSVTGERAVYLFERSSPRLSSINMNLAVTLNKKTSTLYEHIDMLLPNNNANILEPPHNHSQHTHLQLHTGAFAHKQLRMKVSRTLHALFSNGRLQRVACQAYRNVARHTVRTSLPAT